MAPLQPILHGAATSTGSNGGMLTYFPKKLSGSGSEPCAHAGDELFMAQEGFPLLLLNQGGGFAEKGENPLWSSLAKGMLHEKLTASHPGLEMGLHALPGEAS